jgi:small-conductance mechanosensitive channel
MDQAMNPLSRLLNLRLLTVGRDIITPASLVSAAVIMVLAFGAARVAGVLFLRLRTKAKSGRTPLYIVEKTTTYGLVILGLVVGLSTLGIDLSSLAVFAGAIGVGVGLGLQGVVKEFVSGLVLIFDNELHVGDFIELDGGKTRGEVQEIGARATHIRTNDNVDVLVPNSNLIDGTIINWTQKGRTRRIHVPFSVAYGVDKARVREAVLEAARGVAFTLPDEGQQRTQVWMTGFGDSALNFELVVWPNLEAVKRPASMQAAYTWAIEDALRAAEIEMPFPQMDLRLRSLFGYEGEAALTTMGLQGKAKIGPQSFDGARNDAADEISGKGGDLEPPGSGRAPGSGPDRGNDRQGERGADSEAPGRTQSLP